MTWPQLLFDETIWIPHCSFWHIFDWNQWPMHLCRCPNCVVVFPPPSFFWYTKSIWGDFWGRFRSPLSGETPCGEAIYGPSSTTSSVHQPPRLLLFTAAENNEAASKRDDWNISKIVEDYTAGGVSLIIDKTK